MILAIILPSCKTVQVPKFTSIDNVLTLTINSTIQDVENKLGCKPYNIYSNQKDGYTIYVYKYKVLERNVNPKIVNKAVINKLSTSIPKNMPRKANKPTAINTSCIKAIIAEKA